MKKVTFLPLVMFLIALLSCKKNNDVLSSNTNKLQILKIDGLYKKETRFDVGGSIGCTVRFTDKTDTLHYRNNDLYEDCIYDSNHKGNTLGNPLVGGLWRKKMYPPKKKK